MGDGMEAALACGSRPGVQHKESTAWAGLNKALCFQLTVGAVHRVDGNSQLLGELAFGWELCPLGECPGLDLLPKLKVESLV